MVGFDAGSRSIEDLKNGDLQALVVQDPVRIGYVGVKTLLTHLQGGTVERRIDTGVVLVTKANLAEPAMHALLNPPLDKYLKP